jgi:hypothetical protein
MATFVALAMADGDAADAGGDDDWTGGADESQRYDQATRRAMVRLVIISSALPRTAAGAPQPIGTLTELDAGDQAENMPELRR